MNYFLQCMQKFHYVVYVLVTFSTPNGKESTCNAGDSGLIPGSGISPGEGHSNPLRYSCLGNPMDRGGWQAIVHGVTRVGHDLMTKQQQQHPEGCHIKKSSDVDLGG